MLRATTFATVELDRAMIIWGATENSQILLSNIENLTFSYATKIIAYCGGTYNIFLVN